MVQVVSIGQLARNEPLPDLVGRRQAWKDGYPWLHRAFEETGLGARAASDRWRVRIEDELKTTLDFKLRPDGTAVVWCGMSGYDFLHDPTPKELFEGLAEAYRRELERRRRQLPDRPGHAEDERRLVAGPPRSRALPVRALPPSMEDSLTRTLEAILMPRVADLALIFLAVTALTLVLSTVAVLVGR